MHTLSFNGSRLRELRTAAGLSAEVLAAQAHCHPDTVYRAELGQFVPRGNHLAGLASALGVDIGEFFTTSVGVL